MTLTRGENEFQFPTKRAWEGLKSAERTRASFRVSVDGGFHITVCFGPFRSVGNNPTWPMRPACMNLDYIL